MNEIELKVEMLRNKINQTQLAEKLDITKSALNKKINGINDFTRKDISIIKEVLNLNPERTNEIFFNDIVDLKSTIADQI